MKSQQYRELVAQELARKEEIIRRLADEFLKGLTESGVVMLSGDHVRFWTTSEGNERRTKVFVEVKVPTRNGSSQLEESDWQDILSLPWNEKQRRLMLGFYGTANEPLDEKKVADILGLEKFTDTDLRQINQAFVSADRIYTLAQILKLGELGKDNDEVRYNLAVSIRAANAAART